MTQDEADRLIREAEDAWSKKHKGKKPPPRLEQKPKPVIKPIPYSLPKAAPPAVLPHKSGAAVLKKVAPAKVAANATARSNFPIPSLREETDYRRLAGRSLPESRSGAADPNSITRGSHHATRAQK